MAEGREEYAEKLLASVNDAAAALSTRFVTFVTVGAYVAVTVAATTHEMLLRASNLVTLPLLNAQIPIIGPFGFYSIAPWLIVLLHSDLLLQLSILANELDRFDKEVDKVSKDHQTLLRQRVANFYYVLYLTGGAPSRFLHLLSAFITWVTAVMLPLALLLWIQIRFLPFHSAMDTWLHRAAVAADVILIAFILLPRLWPRFRIAARTPGWQSLLRRALSVPMLIVLACVATLFVSVFVATIPDGSEPGTAWFAQNMELREQVLTTNTLSSEDINALRDTSQPEQLRDVLIKVTPFQALQGRDFRHADMFNAVLPKLDLRGVRTDEGPTDPLPSDCVARRACVDPPECEDPGLRRTQLAGANFGWASMQDSMFDDAVLEDANLASARIQLGSLRRARMNRATLALAKLQNAKLDSAKLCGANLSEAEMKEAELPHAYLRGANLQGAKLESAILEGADLRGADLSGADLTNAVLRGAQMQGALLRGATLRGAIFDGANVEHTDLSAAGAKSAAPLSAVNAYLAELACADPSTAHGLSWQALHSPSRDGPGLARALLDAAARADCAGMQALSSTLKRELEQSARQAKR